MSRPLPARTPSAADPFCASPQSVYLDIKKEDMVPHPSREKMEVLSEVV